MIEDGTGTGTAVVPEVSAGLAVLSPGAEVSLAGEVAAGAVVSAGVVVTLPYEDGEPGETGAGEVAAELCEFSALVGFDEATEDSEGAAVGEGWVAVPTSVNP